MHLSQMGDIQANGSQRGKNDNCAPPHIYAPDSEYSLLIYVFSKIKYSFYDFPKHIEHILQITGWKIGEIG